MMGTRVCPRCGAPLAANQPVCGNCGLRFSQQPLAEQRSSSPRRADQSFYGAPTEEFLARSPQVTYGTPPDYANPVPPYTPAPSDASVPPMPRPPKRRSRGLRTALMVVTAVLVFVFISGSVLAILRPSLIVSIFVHTPKPTQTISPKPRNTPMARAETRVAATATAKSSNAHATATAKANATASAGPTTFPFSSKELVNDPLVDNSKGNKWQESENCSFTGAAYHSIARQVNTYNTCMTTKTNFNNITYQVTMQINSGDFGGIAFRGNETSSKYYSFIFSQNGAYFLYLNTGTTQASPLHQGSAASSIFKTGLGQQNQIAVVLRSNTISLYVNQQMLTSVTNPTLSSGQIGVVAYDGGHETDVSFTNAQVWKL